MKIQKYLFIILSLMIFTNSAELSAKTNLDKVLLGTYGPTKNQFTELCSSFINNIGKNSSKDDICLLYFIGLRNGYLTAAYTTMDKAALYYALDGNVVAGSELKSANWGKAFEAKAYHGLEKNNVRCVKEVAPELLLRKFYTFIQSIRRNIGATMLFDEFIQKNYAGHCRNLLGK